MSLGIYLTLLIGKNEPEPAPPLLINALQSVNVTTSDNSQNGFQITFSAGRNNAADIEDYPLLNSSLVKPFNRVRILVSFGTEPKVLIDGIITHQQLNPSKEPGKSTLTLTGKDLSIMMDLEEEIKVFEDQSDTAIVEKIIKTYSKYGLVPKIITPDNMETPEKNNTIPSQHTTDLKYIQSLAKKHKFVFYIENTDDSQKNIAYWGPTIERAGTPQKALTFNMGEYTNVNTINCTLDALQQSTLTGSIQDTDKGDTTNLPSGLPNSSPKLALYSIADLFPDIKISRKSRESGISKAEATAMAQTEANNASSNAVTVTGEIDTIHYKEVLKARHLVALRGVGHTYNGLYYVKQVTHTITKGAYKQNFTLTREGLGSTIDKVQPHEQ
ncbi:MAG: hypothetical protein FWD52_08230 [Candidatus Bathyarchaeota archaeon]|nr:hypothetical protein [Candidatus Termiticorpusculum sp.]